MSFTPEVIAAGEVRYNYARQARAGLWAVCALVLLFVYLPLVVVTINSFNSDRTFGWPPPGYTSLAVLVLVVPVLLGVTTLAARTFRIAADLTQAGAEPGERGELLERRAGPAHPRTRLFPGECHRDRLSRR